MVSHRHHGLGQGTPGPGIKSQLPSTCSGTRGKSLHLSECQFSVSENSACCLQDRTEDGEEGRSCVEPGTPDPRNRPSGHLGLGPLSGSPGILLVRWGSCRVSFWLTRGGGGRKPPRGPG